MHNYYDQERGALSDYAASADCQESFVSEFRIENDLDRQTSQWRPSMLKKFGHFFLPKLFEVAKQDETWADKQK